MPVRVRQPAHWQTARDKRPRKSRTTELAVDSLQFIIVNLVASALGLSVDGCLNGFGGCGPRYAANSGLSKMPRQCVLRKAGTVTNSRLWNWLTVLDCPRFAHDRHPAEQSRPIFIPPDEVLPHNATDTKLPAQFAGNYYLIPICVLWRSEERR